MTPAPRATRGKLKIDVLVDSGLWTEPGKMRSVVRRAIAQARHHAVNKRVRACYRADR